VVNYSRSADSAEETARNLRALGSDAISCKADVTDEKAVASMVEAAVERWGRLDVLVNNAGRTRFIPFPDLDAVTDEVWDELLGVNLTGPFRCARLAAPHLRRQRGAIVNIGSTAGLRASGSSLPYGVSKAALHQLTRGLAVALAPDVRVNTVAPGVVATDWFRRRFGDEETEAIETGIGEGTPLGGVASPEHCAEAVMALLSSDWVTGDLLVVDGGKQLTY
jgi:3-oxoacyl-[acyl-carrier protein] reductase